ncbi:hypothetical protein F8388_025384 [Cannabis sativa]|uniref:Xyloglucan endotransglucosylase/hydrolase n=1 Tax=Cannabis sativa TaxID=3483 RepID=A0A7J6G0I0_CANSA|nr:hypothetical protein F8388_025384 [Cannabis sativa]
MPSHNNPLLCSVVLIVISWCLVSLVSAGNFYQDFDITWGDHRAQILKGGQLLTLSLDKASGSGFKSKNEYLFGRIDMQIKLVPGNSAGTVTAYYLSSEGPNHDEIDFEFLGNLSGDPYTLHTNVFTQGKGNREQQFHLWFDPTKTFHTYSLVWNKQHDWATRGGLVKTDWTKAPFTASYANFKANACVWSAGKSSCDANNSGGFNDATWQNQGLDAAGRNRLRWVQQKFMVYNYCTDLKRFPKAKLPDECKHSRFL